MNNFSPKLLEIAQSIARIDLGVIICRAYDSFRERIAGVLIEWLLDLTKCRLLSNTVIIREVNANELYAPRRNLKNLQKLLQTTECAKVLQEINNPSRLDHDWLFFVSY